MAPAQRPDPWPPRPLAPDPGRNPEDRTRASRIGLERNQAGERPSGRPHRKGDWPTPPTPGPALRRPWRRGIGRTGSRRSRLPGQSVAGAPPGGRSRHQASDAREAAWHGPHHPGLHRAWLVGSPQGEALKPQGQGLRDPAGRSRRAPLAQGERRPPHQALGRPPGLGRPHCEGRPPSRCRCWAGPAQQQGQAGR